MRRPFTIVAAGTLAGLLCAGTMAATTVTAGASVSSHPMATSHIQPGGPIVRAKTPGAAAHLAGGTGLPTVSENWSGYAAVASQKFTFVHSTFTQPKITCPGVKDQVTSNWVGLDGLTDQTVEQDGTFAQCGGAKNKTPQYEAWYELFPANSVNVFAVHAGDKMSVSVSFANGKFTLTVADLTSGKKATHTASCSTCERTSAEYIIERPAFCTSSTKCFLTELADFHKTTMSTNQAQTAGGSVSPLSSFDNIPIYMIQPLKAGFTSLATVGPLSGSSAFTATWDRSGSVTPITLGPNQ
jgi:Peptidase A4 family